MTLKNDFLFHVRFTNPALVSRFTPIPVKRETNGHFRRVLPMTDHRKNMKRRPAKFQSLVSTPNRFVSHRFTFRFI
jgi:hypothetical protein